MKIRREIVAAIEAMTEEIADGTRTDARSVTPNGWTNRRMRRNRPILRRISKSGKRG